jgi:hypothetical protein
MLPIVGKYSLEKAFSTKVDAIDDLPVCAAPINITRNCYYGCTRCSYIDITQIIILN